MTKPNRKPFGPLYQEAMVKYGRERGLKFGTVSVLRALVSFTNGDSGQARPGNKKLMERAGCSEKTLERALKVLRDGGFAMPIAYAKGGRGCASVYVFPLPAWSGQNHEKTTVNLSDVSQDEENINHRHFVRKPPSFCPKTTVKLTDPTERTERTEDMADPSRVETDKASSREDADELMRFGQECSRYGYSEARRLQQARLGA